MAQALFQVAVRKDCDIRGATDAKLVKGRVEIYQKALTAAPQEPAAFDVAGVCFDLESSAPFEAGNEIPRTASPVFPLSRTRPSETFFVRDGRSGPDQRGDRRG